jgi:hypothetical protein
MSLDNHLALVRWISSNRGYLHPNIDLAFDAETGYHARVVEGTVVKAGSCVARCSMATSLSILNALHTPPFSCRGTRFPLGFLGNQKTRVIQCFFLMEQWALQKRSWWAPYLSTLPRPDEVQAIYFTGTEEDITFLKGTNMETAMVTQIKAWKAQYSEGMNQLRKLEWPNAVNSMYTW